MSLRKDIYKVAKKFVRDSILKDAQAKPLFEASVQIPDLGTFYDKLSEKEIAALFNNNPTALLSIVCLRTILEDPLAFTDPADNFEKFGNIARAVRLNDFKEYGKNIDLGFGNGAANNLLYKLCTQYLAGAVALADDQIKDPFTFANKSRNAVIGACLGSDKFNDILKDQRLDDLHTYRCILGQAFYKFHYENFVKGTSRQSALGPANAADGSINSWYDVSVAGNEVKSFVSLDGSPFNEGYPILCVVIPAKGKQIRNAEDQQKILDKAYKYVSRITNRNNPETAQVSTFNHKDFLSTDPIKFNFFKNTSFKITSVKNDTVKVCVGFNYLDLITELEVANKAPLRSTLSYVDYAINNIPQTNIAEKIVHSTNSEQTFQVLQSELTGVAEAIRLKNESVQEGPALFFDLGNKADIDNVQKLVKEYESVEPSTSDIILKRQYSLNLKNVSSTVLSLYKKIQAQYLLQRSVDPRIVDNNLYDKEQILEDLIFYYDNFYNLLAVGVAPRKSTKSQPELSQVRLQKNNIPFEFLEPLNRPVTDLNTFYSVDAFSIVEDGGVAESGVPGPLILVTETYVDLINSQFNNIPQPKGKNFTKTDIIEKIDGKNIIKGNLPRIITYEEMAETTFGSNQIFKTVLLKTSNLFFINANEINLANTVDGIYSFASKGLTAIKGTANFLSGNDTFSDQNIVTVDNIQSFLERFHYPTLLIKPTVPKQKDTGAPDAGLIKNKFDNSPRSLSQQRQKKYDLNDFSSSSKMFNKQVLLIAAQSSNESSLCGLADVVASGNLDDIYDFLLNRFAWDDILARALLSNLKKVGNIGPLDDVQDLANKINACLSDQNIDQILATFANFADLFKNFDKVAIASLPEIPKLQVKLPYIFILDFQKIARDLLTSAVQEAIFVALQAILGIVIKELCENQLSDASLQALIYDKLNLKKETLFGKESTLSDSVNSIAISADEADDFSVKLVFVDLVVLLKASRVDNLDNILNGIFDLFPILKARIEGTLKREPIIVIEEILDGLSEIVSADETKSLLLGTATSSILNKVINYSQTQQATTGILDNVNSINLLYSYLSDYINIDIINEKIVETTVIRPDPCFINLGRLDVEQLEVLQEFLGAQTDQYVDDVINDSLKRIGDLCSKFANGAYELSVELPNLVSDNSKQALQKVLEATLEPIVQTQEITKNVFTSAGARQEVNNLLSKIYLGENFVAGNSNDQIPLTQITLDNVPTVGLIEDLIFKKEEDIVVKYINQSNIKTMDIHNFFSKSLNSNFGYDNSGKVYSNQFNTAPFDETTRNNTSIVVAGVSEKPNITNFFTFFVYWILKVGAIKETDFIAASNILNNPDQFEAFLQDSFEETQKVKDEANLRFETLVNEGGKNSNFFVANIQKMKQIIKTVEE